MADYEASNLAQRAFCEREGIAYSSFCYWRKQLRTCAAVENKTPTLIELAAPPAGEDQPWRIELDLGQGVVLRMR
jgi:hypothetical protein